MKPASPPASPPARQAASKPASPPARQPAGHAASQPARQSASPSAFFFQYIFNVFNILKNIEVSPPGSRQASQPASPTFFQYI